MHSQLAHNKVKHGVRKSFCEDVSKLLFGSHKRSGDLSSFNFFFYEVSISFNMFGSIMLNWIVSNVDGDFIVTVDLHWFFWFEA